MRAAMNIFKFKFERPSILTVNFLIQEPCTLRDRSLCAIYFDRGPSRLDLTCIFSANFRNDEMNTFQSFKFIMFRYPEHSSRINIKCKVSIFSRLIEEDLLPGPCDLHIGAKEGERKRRSIFESFFGGDDDTNQQELEITGGFQLV